MAGSTSPEDEPATGWWAASREVAREFRREWHDDRVTGLAAEVAFFGLFSLFPALVAMAAALGSLQALLGQRVAERAEQQVLGFVERVFTADAQATVESINRLFTDQNTGLVTFGMVAALWAASRGFAAVVNALDVAYDVTETRGYLRVRLRGLGLAVGSVGVGAVILAMLVLGPLLGGGRDVAEAVGLGQAFATAWDWVRLPVAAAIMVAWAGAVYHLAPNHHTPWRWDLPGALLASGLWALLSVGLRLYLAVAAGANQVLGILGGALTVVLWLYLMALGLVLGGELNAILARRAGVVQNPQADSATTGIRRWRPWLRRGR